ncbi:uncharacterized protein LOC114575842 [Exaiptasia diaphana]|uniref:Uncharacterized protein n=1 Tax=Exaiptasia diaphana TaxID=2652724 RepID=A0A913YP46_EXADI|nr:uncharacterized protein LOC114575842 [Exaiptasia diaphana]
MGGSDDWKYIRNKFGCGKMNSKKYGKWCDYDIRMKHRKVSSSTKLVGQLLPSDDKGYWKFRKVSEEYDQSGYSPSEMSRKLLELATQEEDTEEWRRKFKKNVPGVG